MKSSLHEMVSLSRSSALRCLGEFFVLDQSLPVLRRRFSRPRRTAFFVAIRPSVEALETADSARTAAGFAIETTVESVLVFGAHMLADGLP
jgi:hypothetical protein